MENMRGVGWLPVLDTSLRSQTPTTPTGRLCLRRLKDQGVTPQSATDVWTAWNACESFVLYDALLRASSGSSDAATLLGLVPAVASSYVSASTVNGRVGTRGGRVVPLKGRIFAFDEERQFHYVGAPFRL
jgi:hypothetical protein